MDFSRSFRLRLYSASGSAAPAAHQAIEQSCPAAPSGYHSTRIKVNTAMAFAKTYTGGCHCGEVRYETTTDLSTVMACNCSICTKRGILWTFVKPEQFALRSGEEDLRDYQFNKKMIHHLFCSV